LTQNISNLSPNTTYYFRAIANNSYGTITGNTLSFQTTTTTSNIITTVQATNTSTTSAKLNGIFMNQNGSSGTGYFEYGTTAAFGSTTPSQDLGTNASVNFSATVTGLTPNANYFFRAVAISQGLVYNGNTLVFTANGTGTTGVTSNKSLMLNITTNTETISKNNNVTYLVTFKNINSSNIDNTKITVQLPREIDFVNSNFGKAGNNNTVTFDAGTMVPGQIGSITIDGKLNSKAQDDGAIVVTTAVMSYDMNGVNKDEIAYVANHVSLSSGLEANALFGAGFLPSTLLGWLLLILVIAGLVVVGRKLYADYTKKNSAIKNTDQVDNLHI
jgi:hypothetical protein